MPGPSSCAPPLFAECQPLLRHWWGLALLAPALVLGAALAAGARHSPLETAGTTALVTAISFGLLGLARLHTQLAADGVRVRFAPLQSEWRLRPVPRYGGPMCAPTRRYASTAAGASARLGAKA